MTGNMAPSAFCVLVFLVNCLYTCICEFLLCAFYVAGVECTTKKNDVGLPDHALCSTVVQICAPYVPPLCEHDDLNSAISALLSDDSECPD